MSASKTIHDLFVEELQDIYHAENQLTKALPKLAKAASSKKLAQGIELHLKETYRQVERLEQIFKSLGLPAKAKPCEAMKGLIEESKELLEEKLPGEVQDVGIVVGSQKVEHYEIAAYGSLIALARAMGHNEAVRLLEETLAEEKATDEKLTKLAQSEVNPRGVEHYKKNSKGATARYGKEAAGQMKRATGRKTAARRAPAAKASPTKSVAKRKTAKTARR